MPVSEGKQLLSSSIDDISQAVQGWERIVTPLGIFLGAMILGLIVHFVVFRIAAAFAKRTSTTFDEALIRHFRGPSRIIFPIISINLCMPLIQLSPNFKVFINHLIGLVTIAASAWLIMRLADAAEEIVLLKHRIDEKNNLRARKIRTQMQILKKVIIIVVAILSVAAALMTFERVQQIGTSLLASAGLAGIIIGFAAQRSIATLIAGMQIAVTQPIRIDDVVIVEKEWGRIEEITLTYVVVRIWDQRRLIVPITYFLEKPFENWTRVSSELLGYVYLYIDYKVPVDAVRSELKSILENAEQWDGRVCSLDVTNATEKTMELRALTSAADSSAAWELRCLVREKLIEFVRENYPDGLPRIRAELSGTNEHGQV